jgi:hypothetical protein
MTTNQNLLNEIQRIIGGTTLSNLTSATAACDLFEVYVFTLILEAAQREGATLLFEDVHGRIPPAAYIFRTSPGHIYSTAQDYTHAIIQFPNTPTLEAHVGIKVAGKSGVLHECDVAVLYRDEALSCRQGSVVPRHNKVVLTVECKFYATPIPLHQARSFMGLITDIPNGNDRFFVVNTNSTSAEKMLAYHRKNWEHNLSPNAPEYVNKIRTAFQKKFANYKAKHS